MADLIQLRRDTAANWASVNPVLADGEAGIEKDTKKFKVGDGSTTWNSLLYQIGDTDLSYNTETRLLSSSSGDDVTLPLASESSDGLMAVADKTKLDGIEAGAEVNVQPDWDATTGDAAIQNKPTLGTAAAEDVGTSAGNVVQLDEAAKLPAVDGSQLTNLPASGAIPAGSGGQIQFHDGQDPAGLGASADLTWDDTAKELGVGGDINLDDGGTYTTTIQCITPTQDRVISFPDRTGTVALIEGSSGQIIWNNDGVYGGVTGSIVDSSGNITLGSRLASSRSGAASAPPVSLTGAWFTGGTATTTKPQFLIEPAGTTSTGWSTSGTGFGVNAPSGFAGRILDLQLNGVSEWAFSPAELAVGDANNIALGTTTGTKIGTATTQKLAFWNATPVVQPTAVADITTTATTGSLPTPDGGVTIANAATPTVAELLKYCVELEAKLEAALSRLRSLGLIAT
jgi:hypothetical protein